MPPPLTALIVTVSRVPSKSAKPRSPASISRNVSSMAVIVALVPLGASALSSATVTVAVAAALSDIPSLTVTVIVRELLVPPSVGLLLVLE